jgi:AraC-like DNA-binding protein
MNGTPAENRLQALSSLEISIDLFGYLETEPGWVGAEHSHAFWELLYYRAGTGTLDCRGSTFPIRAESLFLMPPNIPHRLATGDDERLLHLYVGFRLGGSLDTRLWDWPSGHDPVVQTHVCVLLDEVLTSVQEHGARALHLCQWKTLSAVAQFIDAVRPHVDLHIHNMSHHARVIGEKAVQYIVSHRCENISVQSVAESLYVSPSYLAEIVRRVTGKTIKQLHREERLRYACELLGTDTLSVTEVALQCGYSSVHYFSREFKRTYGLAPTETRKTS